MHEPRPLAALTRLGSYPWLVVGVACIGAVIGQIDASIVQLTLPTIEREFAAPLNAVSWVAVGYVLCFAASVPVFARISEMAGRKLVYLLGFALFAVFSALCGAAPDLASLIGFRALQGMAGGALGANAVIILVSAAGPERRGRAMGIYAGAQAVGVCAGPALGGVLLSALNWHWVFWVNVPFAALAVVLGWLIVPVSAGQSGARFDFWGAALLVPALTGLLLAISELHAWGPASPKVLGAAGGAAVLLALFVWRESRARDPLLALSLFRIPAFSGGIVAVLLSYAMLYAMFFVMSFALVRGFHETPIAAGLRLTVLPAGLGLVAPFSGGLGDRHPRAVMLAGMACCLAAALGMRALLGGAAEGSPHELLMVTAALGLFGVGLGLFIAPNNSTTLAAAPAARAGQAGGLLNLMRVFGTGTGVAASSAVLAWRLQALTGAYERTLGVDRQALLHAATAVMVMLAASGAVLLMIAGAAVLAGAAITIGSPRRP